MTPLEQACCIYTPHLRSYARRVLPGSWKHEAEDLVQDVVVSVLQTYGPIDPDQLPSKNYKGLLFQVLRNRIIDRTRKSRTRVHGVDPTGLEDQLVEGPLQDQRLQCQLIYEAISSITPRFQLAVNKTAEGLTPTEIALELSVNVNTVKANLCKGRDELADLLQYKRVRWEGRRHNKRRREVSCNI